jgi:polysaccharide biosynthesis/export protein
VKPRIEFLEAQDGIRVLGEVQNPGIYQVARSRNLRDVLSQAGGTTPLAGYDATVQRPDGSVIVVRLREVPFPDDVELAPGDEVFVPRASLMYVMGDVGKPGGFVVPEGQTLSLAVAVEMASGLNSTASLGNCRIIRRIGSGYIEIPAPMAEDANGKIQPGLVAGDVLFIPNETEKASLYTTGVEILAKTSHASLYRVPPPTGNGASPQHLLLVAGSRKLKS